MAAPISADVTSKPLSLGVACGAAIGCFVAGRATGVAASGERRSTLTG